MCYVWMLSVLRGILDIGAFVGALTCSLSLSASTFAEAENLVMGDTLAGSLLGPFWLFGAG